MTHIGSEDERFAAFLRSAVHELDVPETPREQMWAAIAARRQHSNAPVTAWSTYIAERETRPLSHGGGGGAPTDKNDPASRGVPFVARSRNHVIPLRWAMPAAAALLAAGVVIGVRFDRPRATPAAEIAAAQPKIVSGSPERLLVDKHFADAEEFVVKYTATSDQKPGQTRNTVSDRALAEWAGRLLSSTRVLLDGNKSIPAERRKLLSDLELVLTQIATPTGLPDEREYTEQSIEKVKLVQRLKYEVPQATTQQGI